jgi:hypothetical protein
MQKISLLLSASLLCLNCFAAPAPLPIAATHGYVFVQLPRGLKFRKVPTILRLAHVATGEKHGLKVRAINSGVGAIGLWLPAGEYKLDEWEGTRLGEYPTVTVKPGHLTDMGQLVPVAMGGYQIVVLPLRDAEALEGRATVLQEFESSLSAERVIEWQAPNLPKPIEPVGALLSDGSGMRGLVVDLLDNYHRNKNRPALVKQVRAAESTGELLRLAKSAVPPQADNAATDAQSNLYYGAELGQVRVRKPNGEWGTLDTGSLRTVTAVAAHDATLVAGFENGAIRVSKDAGTSWTKVAALSRDEAVVDIDRVGARWIVATRRVDEPSAEGWAGPMNQVKVYAAAQADFSDLASIKTLGPFPSNQRMYSRVHGEAFGDAYYLNQAPALMRLDTKTMTWDALAPPSEVNIFHVSPATETLTAFKAMGLFSKLYVSTDRGVSWTKTSAPTYTVHNIYFENPDQAHALRSDISGMKYQYKLVQYNRADNRWNQTAQAPAECSGMLYDTTHVARFCVTIGGSILSHEKGDWVMEFANE